MEGLKAWRLTSSIARPLSLRQPLGLGSSSLDLIFCCSYDGIATATNTMLPFHNKRSFTSASTSISNCEVVRAIHLKKVEPLWSKGLGPSASKWDRSYRLGFSSFDLVSCCSDGSSATTNTELRSCNHGSSISTSTSTSDSQAVRAIRLKKVEQLRSQGLEPYAYKWDKSHSARELQEIYRNLNNGEELDSENHHVSIAGRIVARRAFGKLAFLTLRDHSSTISSVRMAQKKE